MIIPNEDGTYTVEAVIDGATYRDTFDELYEAEVCEEQLDLFYKFEH